jgi:hypothetical protein
LIGPPVGNNSIGQNIFFQEEFTCLDEKTRNMKQLTLAVTANETSRRKKIENDIIFDSWRVDFER